jgi:hypothetical protein
LGLISLPRANVVKHAFCVNAVYDLSLIDAPNMDALLGKPLCDEWGFIEIASQPVIHKDQKDIKLTSLCSFSNALQLIAGISTDFIARHVDLLLLTNNVPAFFSVKSWQAFFCIRMLS